MRTATVDTSVVAGMMSLHPHEIPSHLFQENAVREATDFDPNTYFSVLTHLSIKAGYELDYVYYYDGSRGYPLLYARSADERPLRSAKEYWELNRERESPLLPFLIADYSRDGFFQLVVFLRLAGQFYLYWHSLRNNWRILTSRTEIEELTEFLHTRLPPGQIADLRVLDPRPKVQADFDRVSITYFAFTGWDGLYRFRESFRRLPPHTLLKQKSTVVQHYDCGIIF